MKINSVKQTAKTTHGSCTVRRCNRRPANTISNKSNAQLIELFCIARLSRIEKEERRRRAWTEMKANGNFQLKNNLKKTLKKRPKLMIRIALKELKNIFTVVKAEEKNLDYKV